MASVKPPRPSKTVEDRRFSAKEERLAALLAAGWKVGPACTEAGVSVSQGYVWRNRPGFSELVETMRSDMYNESLGRLANLTTKAVGALEKLLDDKDTPPAVQVSAARGVLADAMSMRANVDLAARVAEVERLAAERKGRR